MDYYFFMKVYVRLILKTTIFLSFLPPFHHKSRNKIVKFWGEDNITNDVKNNKGAPTYPCKYMKKGYKHIVKKTIQLWKTEI